MPEKTCSHCKRSFSYEKRDVQEKPREHKLLCGDSTKPEDVRRMMGGEKAQLMATDPPYLVNYTGERPNDSGKDWTNHYHEVDVPDADDFFRKLFTNALDVLGPGAAIYCWHAHKRVFDIIKVWRELGILDHQQIIWVKPTPVFGRVFWHFRHEPCLMGWRKGSIPASRWGPKHQFGVGDRLGGQAADCWEQPSDPEAGGNLRPAHAEAPQGWWLGIRTLLRKWKLPRGRRGDRAGCAMPSSSSRRSWRWHLSDWQAWALSRVWPQTPKGWKKGQTLRAGAGTGTNSRARRRNWQRPAVSTSK